jgi:hypothetical protein
VPTRLRMMAPGSVVVAAEDMHEADDAVADAVPGASSTVNQGAWAHLCSRRGRASSRFVANARRSLGSNRGAHWTPGAAINAAQRVGTGEAARQERHERALRRGIGNA